MRKSEIYMLLSVMAGISALVILEVTLSGNNDILGESLISIFSFGLLGVACLARRVFIWVGILFFSFFAFVTLTAVLEGESYSYIIIGLGYSFIVWRLIRHISIKRIVATEHAEPEFMLPPQTFIANQTQFEYPLLLRRIQSLFIDGMLLLFVMVIIMIASDGQTNAITIRISSFVILSILYEPVLTAYGHTLGQRIMGIRVRNVSDPSKRINILQSYIRFVVKNFFGWISFITIHFNREHRAIHDFAGSSVMIRVRPIEQQ